MTTSEQKIALYDLCKAFVENYDIICADDTNEDRIYEMAPVLVYDICRIIGYKEEEIEE